MKLAVQFWMIAVVFVTLAGIGGCSSAGDPEEAPTIDVVLQSSAAAMAGIESASFTIEQTGAEVYIDGAELIQFVAANGRYATPTSADALVSVKALGLSTEIGAVAIGGEIWITNPLTGRWEAAPEDLTFDPSILFDPETGWSALLSEGLDAPELVTEAADRDDRNHVRATVAADRVSILTGGLVNEPSTIDIWIEQATDLVGEAEFDVETDRGPTSWRLTVTDYGADVSIEKPDLG